VQILDGLIETVPSYDEIVSNIVALIEKRANVGIKRVINGTGVILHSNLGRACLSGQAVSAVSNVITGYSNLEFDVEKGKRGSRLDIIEERLRRITGCESAIVVNNNAAAVLLILCAVASGGNVIVSRGELVEIGGGFRVPEILEQCGCILKEVGTTNKTRLSDYKNAIDEKTIAILKIHSSNFKIMGFTESVCISELSELSKEHKIPLIEDIGSGALIDLQQFDINDEPLVAESLKNGADIVSFSGDKLLGGPQCGIILGREKYISKMKKHPLYRALRIDKMTIAALEATLRAYSDMMTAVNEIPVLRMLTISKYELQERADLLCSKIIRLGGDAQVIPTKSTVGGGSVPVMELDSYAVSPISKLSANELDEFLRLSSIPIIGKIEKNRLLLDVRTVFEEDIIYIAEAIVNAG
jgi:L-seryl-tRNA(Ser) seleniumtransferase